MTKNINYVSHKKSKVKNNGKPQLPSANSLVEGEIAINYAKDVETLSIKNESGTVVTFSSDNYYTEKKLGSGFTESNSAVTVTSAMFEIERAISDEASRATAVENALSSGKADKATTLAGYGITDAYTKSQTYTKTEVNGLVSTPHQNYVTVATYASLPATGSADTIYRVSNWDGSANSGAGAVDVTVYSEYAWNGSSYTFLCVKSQIGEVFDISVYNNNAKYDTLADALGTNGEHVPQSIRRGGMSVKYVQNSDNKYVQYRCIADDFTIDTTQWAICGDSIYVENPEYLFAIVDKDKKVLCGIRQDFGVDWAIGIPKPIKQEIHKLLIAIQEEVARAKTAEDTKVDKETGKSLILKDFADRVHYAENPEYNDVKLDSLGHIVEATDSEWVKHLPFGININGTKERTIGNPEFSYAILINNSVVFGISVNGEPYFAVVPKQIARYVKDSIDANNNNVVIRNKDKEPALYAACRYRQINAALNPIQKDFQISIITDTHSDDNCIKNAIDATREFKSIDAIIHCGDLEVFAPRESTYNLSKTIEMFNDRMKTKPWLMVCGNHDVGVSHYIYFTRTHEEVYNDFVKPLIDNGTLKNGEYQTTGNYEDRCYYFHDFVDRKVRLIVLYEYAWPLVLADDNPYWEPVTYDASYPMMQKNTTYTYDASNPIILNCGGWKENSFRLKQTVTTVNDPSVDRTGMSMPCIKSRSFRYFNLNQINWLANVLNNTPNDYGVIIATHIPACVGAGTLMADSNFCIKNFNFNAAHDIVSNVPVLIELVNAWVNKSTLVERVKYTNNVYSTNNGYDVEYVNVLGSGDDTYAYEINLDFSERTNNSCYFGGFLGGHLHVDLAVKSTDYPYQITIAPCCGNPRYRSGNDTANVEDVNSVAYDNITVFSCNNNRIGLARIGNIKTTDGRTRDFEVININS